MRISVGLLICLGGLSTAWGDEPPATPQPAAAPTDQQPAAATGQSKLAPADTPSAAPSATPTTAPNAPAPATPAATTGKPESAPATAKSAKTLGPDDEKNLLAHGYKIETKNGQKYFCRSETPTGTRFPKKTCRTEEQMAATRQTSQDYLNDVQRPSGNRPQN